MKWFVLPVLLVVALLVTPAQAQPATQCATWYGSWNGSQYAIVKGGDNPTDSALGADYLQISLQCDSCNGVLVGLDRWDTAGQYRANDFTTYLFPAEQIGYDTELGQIIYLEATANEPFQLSVCVEADDELPGPDTEPTVIAPTATPEPPTSTPTATAIVSATPTATTAASATPTATMAATNTPTATAIASVTPTATMAATNTPTATMEPTAPATATAIATVPPAMVQLLPLVIGQAGDLVDSAAPDGDRFELMMMGGALVLGFGLFRFLKVLVNP